MSWSAFPTVNNTGVRNLSLRSGLGGVPCLGSVADPDTIQELINNGWNIQSINNLVSLGATDEQLLALPYPASEADMRAAYTALYAQLVASPSTPAATAEAKQTAQLIQQQQQQRVAAALATPPWTNGVVPFGASGGVSSDVTSWVAQNAGSILLVVAAIAIVPPLIKKL